MVRGKEKEEEEKALMIKCPFCRKTNAYFRKDVHVPNPRDVYDDYVRCKGCLSQIAYY